jgi:phenylacetate-coenzyme A ligase PaaK-like adenylate-forming protein
MDGMNSLEMASPGRAALQSPPVISGQMPSFMLAHDIETMPRTDLASLQLPRLRQSLTHAYENVPHIRRKFEAAGVTPAALGTIADIENFPFTEKSDLRDTYPFGLFAVPRERITRLHASSGTTGKPTVVGYTWADLNLWSDLMARTLACAGARLATSFTTPMAMACLRAVLVPITVPSGSAVQLSRYQVAAPSGR